MDYSEDAPDGEESSETSGSSEDKRERLTFVSLGMLLVRSSLFGDSVCNMNMEYTRAYFAHEDSYLININ